jgi:hypothetical protein
MILGQKGRQADAYAEVYRSENYRTDPPSGREADMYLGVA